MQKLELTESTLQKSEEEHKFMNERLKIHYENMKSEYDLKLSNKDHEITSVKELMKSMEIIKEKEMY